MAKKITKRPVKKAAGKPSDDAITPDKILGYFTAAYVLDAVGFLDPQKKQKLGSLKFPGCPTWEKAVEDSFGITKSFVRSVYAICAELKGPPEAVLFILRGLGCPDHAERLQEVMGN